MKKNMKKTIKLCLCSCIVMIACILVFTACNEEMVSELFDDYDNYDEAPSNDKQHFHTFGEWQIETAATCKQEGVEARYCSCGEKQTQIIPQMAQHSTMHGTCAYCGEFVGLLTEEWNTIRVANNDIAQLHQQIALQITMGGALNIDKCNSLVEKINIITNELAKYPNEFVDFAAHFRYLRTEWDLACENINQALTKSTKIAAWKEFYEKQHN